MLLWLPRLKQCSTCRQFKALEDFNLLRRARDGRQYNCRRCNSQWHADHKRHHNAMIKRRNVAVARRNATRMWDYLREHPCVDCGETDPLVLEFDHLRDKLAAISVLIRSVERWDAVLAEIEKCEVVCANCHRRRTARRANNLRWQFATEMAWGRRDSDPHASD